MTSSLRCKLPLITGVALAALGLTMWASNANGLPARLSRDWAIPGQPGPWLSLVGVLLTCCGVQWLRSGPQSARWLKTSATVSAAALGLTTVALLAHATKTTEFNGSTLWWLDDDMMISLRYARNLATGSGLVWNAGEHVEGITNFLWALILVPVHWVAEIDSAARVVIWMSSALFLVSIVGAAYTARELGAGPAGVVFTAFAVATAAPLVHWTSAGGEAPLLSALLLALAYAVTKDAPTRRTLWLSGLAFGAVFATRPDGIVAATPLLAGVWLRYFRRLEPEGRARSWQIAIGSALVVPLLLTVFRWSYYGDPLPNTYYLKATGWDGRADAGLDYLKGLLSQHWVLVTATLGSAMLGGRLLMVSAAPLLHLLYVLRVGGDELPMQRFLAPVLPLFYAAAFAGLWTWCSRLRLGEGAVLATGVLLAWVGYGGAMLPGSAPAKLEERRRSEMGNAIVGKLLEANTEADATIAHFWAGAAPYFSQRRAVDLLGKCDPRIARLTAHPDAQKPGHNKYDFDLSLTPEVDVVVSGQPGGYSKDDLLAYERNNPGYRAFVDLYRNELFHTEFFPNLVRAKLSHSEVTDVSWQWHGIFVRRDSPRARPASSWQSPPLPVSAQQESAVESSTEANAERGSP